MMIKSATEGILFIVFFIWALIFILLFQFSFPTYMGNVIPEIIIFIIFVISCFGIGNLTLRGLRLETSILERFVFSSAVGMIIASIITTLFGFLGILKRYIFLSFLLTFFILSIPSVINFFKEAKKRIENIKFYPKIEFLYLILFVSILFITFLFTLAPPVFYDSLEFHLAVPNYYILKGKITPMEGNVFSNSPLYLQMLYLFLMIIGNEILTPIITFFMGLILNLALISFGRRFFFSDHSFLPSLFLISLPLSSFLMTTPIQDLPLALYLFLALYSFFLFKKNRKNGWLLLTGVFSGFSIGMKYHGLLLLLLIPLLIFILSRNFKENLKFIAVIFIIAILVATPWFLKNLFYTGNPIYPLFFKIFDGKGWGKENNKRYIEDLHIKNFSQMFSILYQVNVSSKIFGAGGIIGPIFIIFLPLFLLGKRDKIANALFVVSIINLFPFLATGNIRYSYLSVAIFCLLISYGIKVFENFKLLKILLALTTFFLVISNTFVSLSHLNIVNPALKLILGEVNKEEYLRNFLYPFQGIEFINKELPPDSLILFLYEARTAYIKRDFISATPYDTNILRDILLRKKDPNEIIKDLRNLRITHIFLNEREKDRIEGKFDYLGLRNSEIREIFYRFISKLKIVYSSSGIYIFSLY